MGERVEVSFEDSNEPTIERKVRSEEGGREKVGGSPAPAATPSSADPSPRTDIYGQLVEHRPYYALSRAEG